MNDSCPLDYSLTQFRNPDPAISDSLILFFLA